MKSESDIQDIQFQDVLDTTHGIIKVVGVGGGGGNAVANMYEEGIADVSFAVCNTDSKALANSPVPTRIQLGNEGWGAGGKPEVGLAEAESAEGKIRTLFADSTQMVFVTAGMGGGTGTGAAPFIAGIAKDMGRLTIGVVTIPFWFEKRRKIIKALKGVEEMRKNVDALLIINNERICQIYGKERLPLKTAFKRADNVLTDAVRSISELITIDGIINLDFRDVDSTMRNGGGAIMAIGRAGGENRIYRAFLDALDSPLLYGQDIGQAKRILFNIYTSDEHQAEVHEMEEIDAFMDTLDAEVEVIWGVSTDDSLGEDVKVSILATGMDNDIYTSTGDLNGHTGNEEQDYDELIRRLYTEPKKDEEKKDNVQEDEPKDEAPKTEEEPHSAKEPEQEPGPDDIPAVSSFPTFADRVRSRISTILKVFEETS